MKKQILTILKSSVLASLLMLGVTSANAFWGSWGGGPWYGGGPWWGGYGYPYYGGWGGYPYGGWGYRGWGYPYGGWGGYPYGGWGYPYGGWGGYPYMTYPTMVPPTAPSTSEK